MYKLSIDTRFNDNDKVTKKIESTTDKVLNFFFEVSFLTFSFSLPSFLSKLNTVRNETFFLSIFQSRTESHLMKKHHAAPGRIKSFTCSAAPAETCRTPQGAFQDEWVALSVALSRGQEVRRSPTETSSGRQPVSPPGPAHSWFTGCEGGGNASLELEMLDLLFCSLVITGGLAWSLCILVCGEKKWYRVFLSFFLSITKVVFGIE